jgi:hypothetical protein
LPVERGAAKRHQQQTGQEFFEGVAHGAAFALR